MNKLQTVMMAMVAGLSVLMGSPARAQVAVGTGFTYQGRLVNAGAPANGLYDLRFSLLDADGVYLGAALCFDAVPVAEGVFTVTLDFGAAFKGDERWLEISVRPDAVGTCAQEFGYTTLHPRQRLSAAPYASFAGAPWATSGGDVSFVTGNVGIGSNKGMGMNPADRFVYDGKNMGHYSLGWFTDSWDLWGSTAWLSAYSGFKFFCQGRPVIAIMSDGSTGIGTTIPRNLLTVAGNADFTGNVGIGTTAPQAKLDVRGDIKLGAGGQYSAVGTAENLRMVCGRVGGAGEIFVGTDFTISHTGPGEYKITLTQPMSGSETITVTPIVPGPRVASATITGPSTFVAYLGTVQGQPIDCPFCFTITGRR